MGEKDKKIRQAPLTRRDNNKPANGKRIFSESIDYGESGGKIVEVRNTLPAPPPRPPKDKR